MLQTMSRQGQIFGFDFVRHLGLQDAALGLRHLRVPAAPAWTASCAKLVEEYSPTFMPQFFKGQPQLMQVVPVEREIQGVHQALPYEQVSSIIEKTKSFRVTDCGCKKGKADPGPGLRPAPAGLYGPGPGPGVFEKGDWGGRVISKEEAYRVLASAEENALGAFDLEPAERAFLYLQLLQLLLCGVLRSINELGPARGPGGQFPLLCP